MDHQFNLKCKLITIQDEIILSVRIFAITTPKTFWQLNIDKQYNMHIGMHEKYYSIGRLNIGNFFTCQNLFVSIYIMYAWYLKLLSPLCHLSLLAC